MLRRLRVRISYTVDVPDSIRRAINRRFGLPGLAPREFLKSFYEQYGTTLDAEMVELASQPEEPEER